MQILIPKRDSLKSQEAVRQWAMNFSLAFIEWVEDVHNLGESYENESTKKFALEMGMAFNLKSILMMGFMIYHFISCVCKI